MSKVIRSSRISCRFAFFWIVLSLSFSGTALAKIVILKGTPMNVKQNTSQGVKESPLTPEEQVRAKIVISNEAGKYFWDSNGKGEMIRKDRKNGFYFVDLMGKGFVEVILDEKSGKYYYMESKSSEGSTYYGVADLFLK